MSSPMPKKRSRSLLLIVVCVLVLLVGVLAASSGLRRSILRLVTPVPTETLLAAVAAGDVSTVRAWTLHEPDLTERTPEGLDALLLAARNGLTEITALLIGAGADVYSVDPAGNTAIHLAAAADHMYTIETLYVKGADLNARNKANETPMHVAARENLPDPVRMLMLAGADPDLRVDVKTASDPIQLAAAAGHWEVVRAMAAMGQRYTLLDAARFGDVEEIDRVMAATPGEASVSAGSREQGPNAIQTAVISGQLAAVKALQKHGAVLPHSSNSGTPIMTILIRMGHREMIEHLIAQGVSIDATTRYSNANTALHEQAKEGTVSNVVWLIEKGANPKALNADGQTPLHIAAVNGNPELAEALVKHGADPSIRDNANQTALDLATAGKRVRVVEYLSSLNPAAP